MTIWSDRSFLKFGKIKVECLEKDIDSLINVFGSKKINNNRCYVEGGLFDKTRKYLKI